MAVAPSTPGDDLGDAVLHNWNGVVEDDLIKTICQTFDLPSPERDSYVYRADSFAMTMAQIKGELDSGKFKYKYQSQGEHIEVPSTDITAYTSIFSATTHTTKAVTAFEANAKKKSPREMVAHYLQSKRISPTFGVSKSKNHINPYYDIWILSCQSMTFLGPLPDRSYANPAAANITHPILPVLYHHFGCAVPTFEALSIISYLVKDSGATGVIDMGSGNGYWTYMLRNFDVKVTPVDSMASEFRTMWINDTHKADGVEFLRRKRTNGGRNAVLLMVYPVVAGSFTKRVIKSYKGDSIVIVGTQNANRYTGFGDCTAEEWFGMEMSSWEIACRVAMPSFAGKDDALFVWRKTK